MKTTIRNKTLLTLAAALLLAAHSVQAEDNTGNGGTITYTDSSGANPAATPWPGGYVVHTFTSSDTLTIPAPVSADVLVVAGGGGGGSFAGGGGAGGLIYSNGFAVSVGSTSVTIGAGGAGGGLNARGSAGSNSVFGALIAYGGGGGGARDGSSVRNGTSGGSGGGGSPADSAPQGMGGTNSPADQGFPGGNGANWGWGGGGGGGAGGIGTNATANYGGAGGVGVVNAIQTGTNQYYGGGGGGGTYSGSAAGVTAGSGGLGGGGAGSRTANGTDGAPNTGGGGGGSEYQKIGGNGGSGIVIVRYPYDPGTFSIALASPANGQSLSSTASVSATASVFSATPPCTVNFYLDSNPVSTTNNAPTTVTVDLGVLALGSHTLYATATDSTFTTVSSGTHTFTVETDTTAPAPNPMTFAIAPGPAGADSVVMTATTATDAWTPPVEYSFENTTNSSNSGWISSTVWTDTGLSPVTVYGYRVKARDAVGNETDWSGEAVTMTPGWPTTNLYWDGGTAHIAGNGNGASQGGSGTWDTTIQNWDLGADYPHVAWYNPNNDTAVFGGTAGTITLGTDITVGGLTFTTADTLTGGTVTFGTPGTISNSTDVTIASVLAGTQPITKSGAGTLSLTGSNTFSGDLVINGGTMANATAAGFGTGTNLTFAGSGTVLPAYSAGGHVLAKSVAVNSGVTATLNVPNQYYHLTFTGAVTGSGSLSVISSDNGAGSVTLPNSANTFTGTLQVGNADYGTTLTVNSLADSVNPIKMYGTTNSSRTANFNLGGGTAAPLLFDSRQIELLGSTGASAFISNNNATPTNTITINTDLLVTSTGPKTLTLGGGNTGTNTFGGVIADAAGSVISLTKAGAGTWILSGANTYTGTTTVSGGTLVLAPSGGLSFKVTDTSANKVTGAGAATLNGSFTIDTTAVTLGAGSSWTLVDVVTKSYGPNFSVTGFANLGDGIWLLVSESQSWSFSQSTGKLYLAPPAEILFFGIPGAVGVIDQNARTIALTVPWTPWGTALETLNPTFSVSSGTCIDQTSGNPPSPTFADNGTATYTIQDTVNSVTNIYTVTVTVTPANTASVMSKLYFPGYGYAWATGATEFMMVVPGTTNVAALAPTFSVSQFATSSPASGAVVNFTSPQTYTVTAQDGSAQDYTVAVQKVATTASGYQGLVLASGPVSYWPLNETSGTTAFDLASGLNPITYGGNYTLGQTGLRSDGNPCVLFTAAAADPANTRAPFNNSLNPNYAFSVECWVKPVDTTVQYLVSLQDRSAGATAGQRWGYALWKNNGGGAGFGMAWGPYGGNGSGGSINGATALVLGTAYHVVYTYDGSKVRLYVNGVLDASADVAIYQPASTSQPGFTIGSRNGVTPAPSFIQDVALYTRALTQTEIQNHYQSTSGGGYASWQTTNGTSQGLDGDHDNDGVPNGIEYFLGGNTNTTGFTALPGVSNSGGTLSVTWTKSADYTGAYGTDFVVETSAALTGDWAPEALSPAGNVTITGNDVSYTFPTPLGARKFARLKVTGP